MGEIQLKGINYTKIQNILKIYCLHYSLTTSFDKTVSVSTQGPLTWLFWRFQRVHTW